MPDCIAIIGLVMATKVSLSWMLLALLAALGEPFKMNVPGRVRMCGDLLALCVELVKSSIDCDLCVTADVAPWVSRTKMIAAVNKVPSIFICSSLFALQQRRWCWHGQATVIVAG